MTVADLQRQRGRDELVCRGERGKRTGIENNIACATPQLPLTFLATPLPPLTPLQQLPLTFLATPLPTLTPLQQLPLTFLATLQQLPLTFLATPLLPLPMMPSSSRSPRLMSLVLAGV